MSFDVSVTLTRGPARLVYSFASGPGLTALFGPSGAGKTSLLAAIAGLLRPAEGRIEVADEVLFDRARGIDLRPEQRHCGYVFQDHRLFPHRSVRQNLLFGWNRRPAGERLMGLDEALAFLALAPLLERMPATLSGGEAQRVAIGRALLSSPRFLLMDEPLASLDAARRDEILRVIERIRDELRLPILYVSHERAEVERLADAIVPVGC